MLRGVCLQLVGAAVVELELGADEYLSCLLGSQLQLQPKPVWKKEKKKERVTNLGHSGETEGKSFSYSRAPLGHRW